MIPITLKTFPKSLLTHSKYMLYMPTWTGWGMPWPGRGRFQVFPKGETDEMVRGLGL